MQKNEDLALSSGSYTVKHVSRTKKRMTRTDSLRRSVTYKRRRYELKNSHQNKTTTTEMREGLSYKTSVDVAGYSTESNEEIPPPIQPLVQRALRQQLYSRVYFDVETTGFGKFMIFFSCLFFSQTRCM